MNNAELKYPFGFVNASLFRKYVDPLSIWDMPRKNKGMALLKRHLSTLGIDNERAQMKRLPKFKAIKNNQKEDNITINNVFDFKRNVMNWRSKITEEDLENKENMLMFDLLSKMKKRKKELSLSKDKSAKKRSDSQLNHHPSPPQIKQEKLIVRLKANKASTSKKDSKRTRISTQPKQKLVNSKDVLCASSQNSCEDNKMLNPIVTTTNISNSLNSKQNSTLLYASLNTKFTDLLQKVTQNERENQKLLRSFGRWNHKHKMNLFMSLAKKEGKASQQKVSTSLSFSTITDLNCSEKLFSSVSEINVDHHQYKFVTKKISKPIIAPRVNINKLKVSEYWNLES